MENNDWNEYKQLFLSELLDNKQFRKEVREMLNSMKTDVDSLKVKAAIAGGMAGMVGTGLVTAVLRMIR